MVFNVWPQYFEERAEEYMKLKIINRGLFLILIFFLVIFMVFKEDYFLVVSLVLGMFLCVSVYRHTFVKKYFSVRVVFKDTGIELQDVLGHKSLKSIAYADINNFEKRMISISDAPKGAQYAEFTKHDLIFVYYKECRYFNNTGLQKDAAGRGYWGVDVFFCDKCIAFAYDEIAWKFLLERIRE